MSKQIIAAIPRMLGKFIALESSGGIIMIAAAVAAIVIANSPIAPSYNALQAFPLSFGLGESYVSLSFKDFVKDMLMVLFFFVIGMELKSEMITGFLAKWSQRFLPLLAAIGGMGAPALIYLLINIHSPATMTGWAIPSATDIAFALSVLVLAGRNIPPSIKIFLLAIAIFDDLGAILIIAFFYSAGVHLEPLAYAALLCTGMYALNRINVCYVWPYIVGGAGLLVLFEHAGIHTTIAGVITGLLIPLAGKEHCTSPLKRAMHFLHPWVSYVILPIFAFISAGVSLKGLQMESLLSPLTLGVALGLFLGKQIGIFGIAWVAIKLRLVSMPESATWRHIYAVSVIAGIGFTMSLFIGMLAFSDSLMQEEVKLGVIAGSLASALLGTLLLRQK